MFWVFAMAYGGAIGILTTGITNDTLLGMMLGVLVWASLAEVRSRMYPAR